MTVGHTVIALVGGALVLDLRLGLLSGLPSEASMRDAPTPATTRD